MIRLPVPDKKLQEMVKGIERGFREERINEARFANLPPNHADDADAAAGGVPLCGTYRNGSALMVRVS